MKKSILVVAISVLLSGLTAYAIASNVTPDREKIPVATDGSQYRTVNL